MPHYWVLYCANRSDKRKDLTFHVFPKDPCRRLVSPLSTFQRTFIYYNCSRNNFCRLIFNLYITNRSCFCRPINFFLALVALRPIFHAYVVSVHVYGPRGELKKGFSRNTFRRRCFLPSFHSALHFFDRSFDLLAQPTATRC